MTPMIVVAASMWAVMLAWVVVLAVLYRRAGWVPRLRIPAWGPYAVVTLFGLYHIIRAAQRVVLPGWFYAWLYGGIFAPLLIGLG